MGQQASNQQYRANQYRPAQKKKPSKQVWKAKTNYDGLLKFERTPFEGCQKIQIGDQIYFLEKTRMDLKDLIKNKIRLRKQFSEDQVIRLIENIVYTLAYLQNVNTPYPDLSTNTILISNGTFKLLPLQIIRTDTFSRLKTIIKQKSHEYVPASPEMIIALRCHQQEINEKQFLYKSNVFALGLILLEVCTLKPSSQCYNLQNYDILDAVITQRIEDIESYYSSKIARIVANMLDYEYDQRMTPKDLSVWVNRQLHETEVQEKKPIKYQKTELEQPLIYEEKPIIKSRLISQPVQIINDGVKTKRLKIGENRIDVIRSKIMKDKLKNQLQIAENIESGKSRLRSSIGRMTERENKSKKKNLPNPYLMHEHYNKGNQKSPYKYQPNHQKRDLGIHDIKKLRNDSVSISNTRFTYKNNYQEKGSSSRQKNIDIKYKYNINEDPDSTSLSATRRKDGERFVRVQKHLIQYKKSLSGKKYDYDIGERYLKQDNKIGDKYQKQLNRPPSRKEDFKQNTSISDFSFEPIKSTNGQNIKYMKSDQPDQKPLSRKENNSEWTISKSDIKEKKTKESMGQITYERHQQLFQNEGKDGKRMKKESQDMLMIKKQIQRSRKIIEEVRRSQQEKNIFDQ